MTALAPTVNVMSERSRPTSRQCSPMFDLALDRLRRPHGVPHVRMAGHDAQGALLPSPADHHRETLLDRVGQQAQVVDRIPAGRGHALLIEQAADDVRSLIEPADALAWACSELEAVRGVLGSNQPAPMPRIARPPLMWSSVVASFAVTAGWVERVGADEEAEPDRWLVRAAHRHERPTRPRGWAGRARPAGAVRWSTVQRWSKPRSSTSSAASRRSGQLACRVQRQIPYPEGHVRAVPRRSAEPWTFALGVLERHGPGSEHTPGVAGASSPRSRQKYPSRSTGWPAREGVDDLPVSSTQPCRVSSGTLGSRGSAIRSPSAPGSGREEEAASQSDLGRDSMASREPVQGGLRVSPVAAHLTASGGGATCSGAPRPRRPHP